MAFSTSDLPPVSRPSSSLASPPPVSMRSRNQSISSDRPSTISHSLMSPPLSVDPEACFIAASAASQIVTNDHDSHADTWYDQNGIEPSGETAVASPAALRLVNGFLDQLLFNFLSLSRSTTLSALRPAVSEVLKPKLAKDAINQADEELREYLGAGDDEDTMLTPRSDSSADWDLELVWKRTRLRCMVYSSLGDMEEEDEDYYMEQGHLVSSFGDDAPPEIVSPAVAIFLTSILEFMGEQALIVAGQAAYSRIRSRHEKELKEGCRSPADLADRIVVEELDMERVALDRTLGRLWRAWKKKIRSPGLDRTLSRSFSRDSMRALGGHMRQTSFTTESVIPPPTVPEPAETEPENKNLSEEPIKEEESVAVDEYSLAVNIPLPINDRDVEEIEIPWLVSYSDDDNSSNNKDHNNGRGGRLDPRLAGDFRPKSLMILPCTGGADLPTPTLSQPHTPIVSSRQRSNSLPTPAASPYASPSKRPRVQPIVTAFGPLAGFEAERGMAGEAGTEKADTSEAKLAEATPPLSPTSQGSATSPGHEGDHRRRSSKVSAIISGAVAVGNAAINGVTSIANGSALQTEPESFDEAGEGGDGGEDVDEFIEEPQILTSSRISLSGRSTSPAVSDYNKPAIASPVLPARSPSVHSLRLIDVPGPRSPSTRSMTSLADANDVALNSTLLSTNNNHNNSGITSSPIIEEVRPAKDVPSPKRSSAGYSTGKPRIATSPTISEARASSSVTSAPSLVSPRVRPSGRHAEVELGTRDSHAASAHLAQRHTPPVSPVKQTTKVTILRSTTTPYPLPNHQRPVVPEKPSAQARVLVSEPPPNVPERSFAREFTEQASQKPQLDSQAETIGIVTVERPRARTVSESTTTTSHERQGAASAASTASSAPRQLHTSGSSSTSSTNKLKPVRTSEESGHASTKAEMARNFEELIQSDQTIQYTLTPEGMRDIEAQPSRSLNNGSPVVTVKTQKGEDARLSRERSRSSSVNRSNETKKSSPPAPTPAGFHSSDTHTGSSKGPNGASSSSSGPAPRIAPAIPPKPRAGGPQAREARLQRESLSDFAEFIRSTGPPGEAPSPISGAIGGAPAGGNAFTRAMGPPSSSASASTRNVSAPLSAPKQSIDSSRASTSTSRARLQAREAAVARRDDNSDLIDFIRRGPPSTAGNPRIPRTVAPFRSTMDSDQMSTAIGGKAVDAQIRDLDVRGSETSDYSSVTSQSALLKNKNLPGKGASGGGHRGDPDMPMPPRKSRRVRDPYAFDFSDEEGILEEEIPSPSSRPPAREESLADFLKNYPPPPEPPVQPLASSQNQPKKKASAPSLISRFTRRDSSQSGPSGSKSRSDTRSLNSRAGGGRGHVPIQVTMPSNGDQRGPSSISGSVAPSTSSGGGTSRPRTKHEARDATPRLPRTGTSDLADFLRNSGPPAGSNPPAMPSRSFRDDMNGFSRVFSSRRKPSLA